MLVTTAPLNLESLFQNAHQVVTFARSEYGLDLVDEDGEDSEAANLLQLDVLGFWVLD